MMTKDETIYTAMIYTKIDGILCRKKEMSHHEEVVREVFLGKILYTSLEDTWRNRMSTIKIFLNTT